MVEGQWWQGIERPPTNLGRIVASHSCLIPNTNEICRCHRPSTGVTPKSTIDTYQPDFLLRDLQPGLLF